MGGAVLGDLKSARTVTFGTRSQRWWYRGAAGRSTATLTRTSVIERPSMSIVQELTAAKEAAEDVGERPR